MVLARLTRTSLAGPTSGWLAAGCVLGTRFLLAQEMPVHEDYRRRLIEALSLWAGQSVALARKPQPAADIVAELTSRL